MNPLNPEKEAFTLSGLNRLVRNAIQTALPQRYWVRAETSDVRVNAQSGHCYLEFVEKDEVHDKITAKARGAIWARTFQQLKPYFEQATNQLFTSGLKVLVEVSVEFHELYGYSLNVHNIDPHYTLGGLLKKRAEIIRRLQEEGVIDLNRELPFPSLPQRIAIITSPTAAGYEDFVQQLLHNKAGYPFYLKLFQATMQGERVEETMINALDAIYQYEDDFDVVVIIRGGGAASDLNCFDSYPLAARCAQFPLPIITGIGHDRDETVLDMIAHTRMKTPTAVAAFLIHQMDLQAEMVAELERGIVHRSLELLATHMATLHLITTQLPALLVYQIERAHSQMRSFETSLTSIHLLLNKKEHQINELAYQLRGETDGLLAEKQRDLELLQQYIKMASPEYVLKRGYSLSIKEGKIIKSAAELHQGDLFTLRFADGEHQTEIQ